MPIYECTRQVECIIQVEASNEQELLRKLHMTADDLVEQADAVEFATDWNVSVEGLEGDQAVLIYDDADVADAVDNAPEPWVSG